MRGFINDNVLNLSNCFFFFLEIRSVLQDRSGVLLVAGGV